MIYLVDTFNDIESFRSKFVKDKSTFLPLWKAYMLKQPDLFEKLIKDCVLQKNDIEKDVAPLLKSVLADNYFKMQVAHNSIKNILPRIKNLMFSAYDLDDDIYIVVYFGLLNGAGRCFTYRGEPAILLGLEMIAKYNWHNENDIESILLNQMAKIALNILRKDIYEPKNLSKADLAIKNLYVRGYAQFYEQNLHSKKYHQLNVNGYENYCRNNFDFLCENYAKCLSYDMSVSQFFASDDNFDGHAETGYYIALKFMEFLMDNYGKAIVPILSFEKIKQNAKIFLKL